MSLALCPFPWPDCGRLTSWEPEKASTETQLETVTESENKDPDSTGLSEFSGQVAGSVCGCNDPRLTLRCWAARPDRTDLVPHPLGGTPLQSRRGQETGGPGPAGSGLLGFSRVTEKILHLFSLGNTTTKKSSQGTLCEAPDTSSY